MLDAPDRAENIIIFPCKILFSDTMLYALAFPCNVRVSYFRFGQLLRRQATLGRSCFTKHSAKVSCTTS